MQRAVSLDPRELRTAGAVLLAAGLVLPLLPEGAGIPCPLRTATGVPCPLCGMTTSVVATLRGDLAEALAANPGGVAAVAAAILLLVLRPARLRVPAALPVVALAAMWAFELRRFSVL